MIKKLFCAALFLVCFNAVLCIEFPNSVLTPSSRFTKETHKINNGNVSKSLTILTYRPSQKELSMLGYDPLITFALDNNFTNNLVQGNPVLHLHGHGGSRHCSIGHKQSGALPGNVITFNFPEVVEDGGKIDSSKVSFGQWNDVRTIIFVLKKCKEYGINTIDLYAPSRGGGAACNLFAVLKTNIHDKDLKQMGINKHTDLPAIGSIVFESPFAELKKIIENIIRKPFINKKNNRRSWFKWMPKAIAACGNKIAPLLFGQYSTKGLQPLQSAQYIDRPVLLATPPHDTLIPLESSKDLFNVLQRNRCPKTYFIYTGYNENDNHLMGFIRKDHVDALHAFRKLHNGSYDSSKIQNGTLILDQAKTY